MVELISNPIWQGIGVVVVIIIGFITFYYESKKNKLWLYLTGAAFILLLGMCLGAFIEHINASKKLSSTATLQSLAVVQKIDFDYQDSPINNGWAMIEAGSPPVVFSHMADENVGGAIDINSPVKYGMDFNINSAAIQFGNMIEFVADMRENAAVYALAVIRQESGNTTTGWLKFVLAEGKILPTAVTIGSGNGSDEWLINVSPVLHRGGNWLLFQVDLRDAVNDTFGKDGWSFSALQKLRLRGNLSLDYITIFHKSP